jgi:hypothetical protein
MSKPSEEHELSLTLLIQELKNAGYHVIKTYRKIPAGIATKDGKIYAVEVLGRTYKNKKWKTSATKEQKIKDYKEFDGVLFGFFLRPKKTMDKHLKLKKF